ncbi:MAG: hypothetical protein ABIY90_01180 [Puia sp.]
MLFDHSPRPALRRGSSTWCATYAAINEYCRRICRTWLAYFSGGLLATTAGVDGVGCIMANVTKIAMYATQGKKVGDAVPTNIGGMLGAANSDRLGSEMQKNFQSGDNILMLVLSGGPAYEFEEAAEASSSMEGLIHGVGGFTDLSDVMEEVDVRFKK